MDHTEIDKAYDYEFGHLLDIVNTIKLKSFLHKTIELEVEKAVKEIKPSPPVNESWAEDLSEYAVLHSEGCCANSEGGCDVGVGPIDCCDNMVMIGDFIRTLLSTARQEAVRESKEELLRWITKTATKSAMAGVYGYDFVHRLEEKLKHEIFDSLTSKGGTNGV